jgi:hypothetical protein
MPIVKYKIISPTIAVRVDDGRSETHHIPAGTIIELDTETFDGNKLVNVTWNGTKIMMFTQDVRLRGQKME